MPSSSRAVFLAARALDCSAARLLLAIVSGKAYDADEQGGQSLWGEVEQRLQARGVTESPATFAAIASHAQGKPQIVLPRLGQGLFRVVVTEAYDRRCAFTGERTLPVLDAAHIRTILDIPTP